MNEGTELLRRYAREREEQAFVELIARYFDFVHGVASRRLGANSRFALDVVQVVFTDLARQARTLRDDSQLGGWLHSHTCFIAANYLRTEARRAAREQQAMHMNALENSSDDLWTSVAPVIDEALQDLNAPDRAAILLRYFEGRDLRAVGEVLSVTEDAAQKRVQRALERLKEALEGRGIAVAAAALAAMLLSNASPAHASPPVGSIVSAAIAKQSAFPLAATAAKRLFVSVAALALLVVLMVFNKTRPLSVAQTNRERQKQSLPGETKTSVTDVAPAAAILDAPTGPILLLHVLTKANGQPIRGARVLSTSVDPRSSIQAQEKGETLFVTDANGDARIPVPDPTPERLRLLTSAEGHGGWVSLWEKYKGEEIPREFTIQLDPAVQLGGRVVDESGNAVEGAEIQIGQSMRNGVAMNRDHQRAILPLETNVTDATGHWFANHVSEAFTDSISLSVRHADFIPNFVSPSAKELSELRERTWEVLLKKGLEIAGQVTNQKGEPVAGAKVRFGGETSANRKETVSDATGRYQLKGLPTDARILARQFASAYAPGFGPVSKSVNEKSADGELNFVLAPAATIRARVQNAAGEPLKHIRVSREFDGNKDGLSFHFETDDDGRFVWNEAPNEPQSFYFVAPGYQQLRGKMLKPGEEEVVTLQKDVQLHGTVKDAVTGKPVPEFSINQGAGTTERFLASSGYERTFKDGKFEVALGEANYKVIRVRAAGYIARNFEIPNDYQFDVSLQPATLFEGVVVDAAGQPVEGAEVVAMGGDMADNPLLVLGRFAKTPAGDRALSDGLGHFKMRPGADPVWFVTAHPVSGFAQKAAPEFQKNPRFQLEPWGRVEGTTLSNNVPIQGLELGLNAMGSAARLDYTTYRTTTDQSGRFAFDFVPPTHNIFLSHPSSTKLFAPTNISVPPGGVREVRLNAVK